MATFPVTLVTDPAVPDGKVFIVSLPDTIATTIMYGKGRQQETFVTLTTLAQLQDRIPDLSFDNPIAQASYDGVDTLLMVKPVLHMNEDERRLLEAGDIKFDFPAAVINNVG